MLTVQALFFADDGLLAPDANLFNVGVLPCQVACPLVYRPIAGEAPNARRMAVAALAAAIVGLQLGALAVVAQPLVSAISSLPVGPFASLMLPIHLAIGIGEGLATAALLFLRCARPELMAAASPAALRQPLLVVGAAAVAVIGTLSWWASTLPDGLEWLVAHAAIVDPGANQPEGVHTAAPAVQRGLAHRARMLADGRSTELLADVALPWRCGLEPPTA